MFLARALVSSRAPSRPSLDARSPLADHTSPSLALFCSSKLLAHVFCHFGAEPRPPSSQCLSDYFELRTDRVSNYIAFSEIRHKYSSVYIYYSLRH